MKVLRSILPAFIILTVASCEEEKKLHLQGHWHSIDNAHPGVYQTLDVDDTTSVLDQFTLSAIKFHPIPLKDGEDYVLPTIFTYHSNDIQDLGDTLIVEKEFKYVKVQDCMHQKDLFSNLFVDINLPSSIGDITYGKLIKDFHPAFISVGKLKNGIVYKTSSGDFTSSDSYFIQINDVLPGPEYIPAFILTEYNASLETGKNGSAMTSKSRNTSLPESYLNDIGDRNPDGPEMESKRLAVVLNFDKDVPDAFRDDILEIIKKMEVPFHLLQTVWNEADKKPAFKKL